jgi:hypothetical protein
VIEIPSDERAGLLRLPSLTDDQITDLRTKIGEAKLLIDRDSFTAGVPPVKGLTTEDQQRIIWALLWLHSFLPSVSEASIPEFIRDVCASVVEGASADPTLIERLTTVLPSFFEIDALKLRSKAVELHVDHASPFQSAKVYTDIRPVFAVGSAEKIVGAIVSHTLKIIYFAAGGLREAFFVLDDRDMNELKETIARAELKARAVKNNVIEKLQLEDFGTDGRRS